MPKRQVAAANSNLKVNRPPSDPWLSRKGHAPGLEGVTGKLELQVAHVTVGVLRVENGFVEFIYSPAPHATASASIDSQETLERLLTGRLHPIVARLQGRLTVAGDAAFAIRVLLGLLAGSPWSSIVSKG